MRANNPNNLIGNEGYYFEEEVDMNNLGLRAVIKLARGWHFTAVKNRANNLPPTRRSCRPATPYISLSSDLPSLCVSLFDHRGWLISLGRGLCEEKKRERERGREV